MFARMETIRYFCTCNERVIGMEIKVIMSEEARNFVLQQPQKVREKIDYNLNKVKGGAMEKDLFKKLEGSEIWEFRTLFNGVCYRLFAFWDNQKGALVIVTHGIIKKSQKTPQKEIAKAEAMRKYYLNNTK